jgi:hypothetical protein
MGGLVLSTVLTAILLPATTVLAEDWSDSAGRGLSAAARWVRRPRRQRSVRPDYS